MRILSGLVVALAVLSGCSQPVREAGTAGGDPHLERVAEEHAGDVPERAAAAAVPSGGEVLTQTVTYADVAGRPVEGFVAWPAAAEEPLPAVMLVHEWWGLNDNVRDMARALAGEGYLALAVDLYGGEVAGDPGAARALVEKAMADPARVESNLRQAFAFLERNAQAPAVGAIGWCFGGGWSLRTALMLPDQLAAAVIYYGRLEQDPERLATLQMPLLGIFGEQDQSIPVADVERFERTLESLGKDARIYVYEGVGHAFANPSGTRYDPDAAADAWRRTLAFLDEALR